MPLCSVVLGRGPMLSSAFTELISLGGLPGLDHGFCTETVRGLLSLFWVQDCKICSWQLAARVLCRFNADAEQTDLFSPWPGPMRQLFPARGLLSSQS